MKNNFYHFLKRRIQQGKLPGRPAQFKMVPKPVSQKATMRKMDATSNAKQSSVLVLLFPDAEQKPELVLTVRSNDIAHGGEISFPGGRQEKDESAVETALREAREEIGIQLDEVKIAGVLSPLFVNHSNNMVSPIAAFLPERPVFKRNTDEVQEVFTVPIEDLLDKQNLTTQNWRLSPEVSYQVPFWNVHSTPLWGATAMMLSELLDLYDKFRSE